jgi:Skp family chaperone for outer membrane proteins
MLISLYESNFIKLKEYTETMKLKRNIITMILLTATITSMLAIIPVQAYTVVDTSVCYGYNTETLVPEGESTNYLTTSEYVGFWANITDPPTDIRVVWLLPSEDQYQSNSVTVVQKTGKSWGIVFNKIKIQGNLMSSPGNHPGVWIVQLWINHELETEQKFQIIDYDSIVEDIISIQNQVKDIAAEKNNLQNNYQDLQTKYLDLQTDYQTLQTQTSSSSELEKMQDDYDELYDNYRGLQVSLGTTRMMMYAAVVVAIASVLVAVYFGAIKH